MAQAGTQMVSKISSSYVRLAAAMVIFGLLFSAEVSEGQQGSISNATFNALLGDLQSNSFFTAAAALRLLARPYLRSHITLLVPTDSSLAQAGSISPRAYPDLIRFHILERNLNFDQLRTLPVGTWIPTLLPNAGVQVTANAGGNVSLDGVPVIRPNLCRSIVSAFITCQGMSAILNPNSPFSPRPSPNPFLFAGVPPSPTPAPVSLPPAPSPFTPLLPPSPTPVAGAISPVPAPQLAPVTQAPAPQFAPVSQAPAPVLLPLPPPLSPPSSVPTPPPMAVGAPPLPVTAPAVPPGLPSPPSVGGTPQVPRGQTPPNAASSFKTGAAVLTCLTSASYIIALCV
ncbi:hypothetical protein KP509_02G063200 [Ceratopteris richardii]|uniref:FAS1 domain-containing protein n=1 Tax=Ceratopteris richardii TaxID=49495 RepID=A0A8T2VEN9_CERRI|nr:hypothetical protein KP509_02G063200 [Ceratopteris richardii]